MASMILIVNQYSTTSFARPVWQIIIHGWYPQQFSDTTCICLQCKFPIHSGLQCSSTGIAQVASGGSSQSRECRHASCRLYYVSISSMTGPFDLCPITADYSVILSPSTPALTHEPRPAVNASEPSGIGKPALYRQSKPNNNPPNQNIVFGSMGVRIVLYGYSTNYPGELHLLSLHDISFVGQSPPKPSLVNYCH